MITHEEIIAKLSQLETDLEQTQTYLKDQIKQTNQTTSSGMVFCYFTYSVVMDYEQDDAHLIMGNFHIQNASSTPVVSPNILLKISTEDEFQFLGKYKLPNQTQPMYNLEWERVELKNFDPITHYYLRPTNTNEIPPGEQLSFQSFQIQFPFGAAIGVDGFLYYEGKKDGIAAINYINIAG